MFFESPTLEMMILTKKCTKCTTEKPLVEFSPSKQGKFGVFCYCKKCSSALATERYHKDIVKSRAKMRENRLKNPEKARLNCRNQYHKNKNKHKNYSLKKYNIDLNDYNEILKNQNNCCAICKNPQSDFIKSLAVDHDHKTGRIRALLCEKCNVGLGSFRDNPELLRKAADYIEFYNNLILQ